MLTAERRRDETREKKQPKNLGSMADTLQVAPQRAISARGPCGGRLPDLLAAV